MPTMKQTTEKTQASDITRPSLDNVLESWFLVHPESEITFSRVERRAESPHLCKIVMPNGKGGRNSIVFQATQDSFREALSEVLERVHRVVGCRIHVSG